MGIFSKKQVMLGWGWGCGKCNGRHHTSICDKMKTTLPPIHKGTPESLGWSDRIYGAMDSQNMCTLHATVIAKVGGVQARIMLDSGTGSSYISSSLLTELNLKLYQTERKVIEQMYGAVNKHVADWLSCAGKWPQQPEMWETVETAKESVKPKCKKQLLAKEEEKNPIVD